MAVSAVCKEVTNQEPLSWWAQNIIRLEELHLRIALSKAKPATLAEHARFNCGLRPQHYFLKLTSKITQTLAVFPSMFYFIAITAVTELCLNPSLNVGLSLP